MDRYDTLTRLTSLLGFYQSPQAIRETSIKGPSQVVHEFQSAQTPRVTSVADPKVKSAQSLIADGISSSSGSSGKAAMPSTQSELAMEMMKCLHRDDSDALGGAICKLPAMELESPDEGGDGIMSNSSVGADIMPSLGQSHEDIAMRDSQGAQDKAAASDPPQPVACIIPTAASSVPGAEKPQMAASVLHMMANANTNRQAARPNGDGNAGSDGNASGNGNMSSAKKPPAPAASLLAKTSMSSMTSSTIASTRAKIAEETSSSSANSTKLEMAATLNMGRLLSFTRTSSPHAPGAMIRSLFSSFSTLVNSRVRTWTLLLLRHSLSSGDENSRNNLMSLLASQHSYELRAMITEFTVDDEASEMKELLIEEGMVRREARLKAQQLEKKSGLSMEFCDMILPLRFKATIDITVQDHQVTVNLDAPGSVGAIFHEDSSAVSYLECKVDTNALIKSMIEQARIVVFQSVARATSSSREVMNKMAPPQSKENSRVLNSLGSRLSLDSISDTSSSNKSSSLPANSSASSSSSAAVTSLLKRPGSRFRSNRSVQWDNAIKNTNQKGSNSTRESGKKRSFPSLGGVGSLKRSAISFGRPGSDIFRSSRNATFAEFGNAGQNSHVKNSTQQHKAAHTSSLGSSRYHVSTHILQRGGNDSNNQSSGNPRTNASFQTTGSNFNSSINNNATSGSGDSTNHYRKPSFQELSRRAVYSVIPPAASASFLSLQGMTGGTNDRLKRTPTQLETLLLSTQTKRRNSSNRHDIRPRNSGNFTNK